MKVRDRLIEQRDIVMQGTMRTTDEAEGFARASYRLLELPRWVLWLCWHLRLIRRVAPQ